MFSRIYGEGALPVSPPHFEASERCEEEEDEEQGGPEHVRHAPRIAAPPAGQAVCADAFRTRRPRLT